MRSTLANHIKLALEGILNHHVGAATDKDLTNDGFGGPHRRAHFHRLIHGHVAPAEHHLAFLFDHAFELLLAGLAGGGLPRQKDHANAIVAGRREFDSERCHFFTIKRIRNLNQNARTVTAQGIGTDGAAMIKIVKDEQSIFNDLVRYMSLDIGHKADTAGVVLGIRTIQAFCGSLLPHGLRTSHGVLPFVRVFLFRHWKAFFRPRGRLRIVVLSGFPGQVFLLYRR